MEQFQKKNIERLDQVTAAKVCLNVKPAWWHIIIIIIIIITIIIIQEPPQHGAPEYRRRRLQGA